MRIEEVIEGIKVPKVVKYLGEPNWEDVVNSHSGVNTYKKAYLLKEKQIKLMYSGVKARLKLRMAKESLLTLEMIRFLELRDNIIMKKNNMIIDKKLYRHDLDLNKKSNLLFIYESQKGYHRFPYKFAYEYYIKTGKEPYRFV